MGRSQYVTIHNVLTTTIILNTGAPQECILSPRLYTLLTYDCSARYTGNHIVKFANDTVDVVGLLSNNNKSVYRREVEDLVASMWQIQKKLLWMSRGRHTLLLPSSLRERL